MKASLLLLCCAFGLAGCTLPVPKTAIAFNPTTRTLSIQSPKDVKFAKVELLSEGTNFTLTVTDYSSANNVEVIRAAVEAQQSQMAEANKALNAITAAAIGAAK